MVSPEIEKEIQKSEWWSLDGIICNILIIYDTDKYFTEVWYLVMNQMNRKNHELYQRTYVDIDRIGEKYNICIV